MIKLTMFGVNPSCMGGVSTLVRMLVHELGFDNEFDFEYIPTATQGSACAKMQAFARAIPAARKRFASGTGIVHIHMADGASVWRARKIIQIAKRFGQKIILHIHCDLAVIRKASSGSLRAAIDCALLNADHIIVLGTYLYPLLEELGIPQVRITVLPNAVPCPSSNLYTTDRDRILFLGNVSEEKGVLDLLEALAAIDGVLDDRYVIDICGRDQLKIEDEIVKRNLQNRFFYRGIVSQDENFFAQYLLNVLPSHKEAMPFSLLESSAAGIPSIATAVGSIPELIDGPARGYLVPSGNVRALANALLDAINNPSALRDISDTIFSVVRRSYSLDRYLMRLKAIYHREIGLQ